MPAEWKQAYPSAKMIGMEGLAEKKKNESWKFDNGMNLLRIVSGEQQFIDNPHSI